MALNSNSASALDAERKATTVVTTGRDRAAAERMGITLDEYIAMRSQGLKRCCDCLAWLDKSAFHLNRTVRDGIQACCKPCLTKRTKANKVARKLAGKSEWQTYKANKEAAKQQRLAALKQRLERQGV